MPNIVERAAFGNVLAKKAIEVLVGTAFPRMVWIGEVAGNGEGGFELLVGMEFRAVVERDRLEPIRFGADDPGNGGGGMCGGPVGKLRDP